MDRRAVGSALIVLLSLLAATGAAALVVLATEPVSDAIEIESGPPLGIELPIPPVIAARGRAVSKTVLATADAAVTAAAPGIALESVAMSPSWEERRATIRDLTTGDVRAYAIGDLLPHGSLLVGLSTESADVMIADAELVRLSIREPTRLVEDFRADYEARRAPQLDRTYRATIEDAVRVLSTVGAEAVQAELDELIECGDPAVEVLIGFVGDGSPIAPGPYQIPAGSGVVVHPNTTGDAVIAVLESITGQTFGDPTRASEEERLQIARAWERWWGVP